MSELAKQEMTSQPWHRYGWVWFVFSVPFTAVLFGILMLVSANFQPDDLVVDNYYKEGMAINEQRSRDSSALAVGARAHLEKLGAEGAVFVVEGGDGDLTLSLYHVTNRARDLSLSMTPLGDGRYVVNGALLADRLSRPGVWYLEISNADWRLRQRVQTPLTELVLEAG